MRRAAKVDANHAAIVRALRGVGCTVQSLASVGSGCPDLLVGIGGVNYVIEVKSGPKERLTDDEAHWIAVWRGQVAIVDSVQAALEVVGVTVLGR